MCEILWVSVIFSYVLSYNRATLANQANSCNSYATQGILLSVLKEICLKTAIHDITYILSMSTFRNAMFKRRTQKLGKNKILSEQL